MPHRTNSNLTPDDDAAKRAAQEDQHAKEVIHHVQMNLEFGKWAERIMRYATGKNVLPMPSLSRRKTNLQSFYIDGLKAMSRMFAVGEDLEWKHHKGMFQGGWRQTSWAEISRLGSRRPDGAFTPWEVRQILRALERAGIIERNKYFKSALCKSDLFIKFNGQRLFELVEMVKKIEREKITVPPIVQVKIKQKPAQKSPVSLCASERAILSLNTITSSSSGAVPVVLSTEVHSTRGNSGQTEKSFSKKTNPMNTGSPEVIAMMKLIAEEFDLPDGLTHKQASMVRRYNSTGKLGVKMTLSRLREFFKPHHTSSPYYEARTVDYFLHNWVHALHAMKRVKYRCDEVYLAPLVPKFSFEQEVDFAKTCIESMGWGYLPHDAPLLPALVAYSAYYDAKMMDRFLGFRRDEIIVVMRDNPACALQVRKLVPNVDTLLGLSPTHWTGIKWLGRDQFKQRLAQVAQARAWIR